MTVAPSISWPIMRDATFVCEACCPLGQLRYDGVSIFFECPEHLSLRIEDGKVIEARTVGIRH